MRRIIQALVVTLLFLSCTLPLVSCTGSAFRYEPAVPEQTSGVAAAPGAGMVSLSWTPVTVAYTYNVYYITEMAGTTVTKANAVKLSVVNTHQIVVTGLHNNVRYYFAVSAVNKNGEEGALSSTVSAMPSAPSTADLEGTWYFHTLVTGPGAKWQRGSVTFDRDGKATYDGDFEDSDFEGTDTKPVPPDGFTMAVAGSGDITLTEKATGALVDFNCTMGSRKNMLVATWSPNLRSRALTVFQKMDSSVSYSVEDIGGTGSGQNPNNAYLQGNGPTRFAHHTLYSGANTEWEYCNAKVGQHGYMWVTIPKDIYKDCIYWDFSTPFSKTLNYDFFWKVTSFGIDRDGTVKEHWNFDTTIDPVVSPSFNGLVPKVAHDVVFQGKMTADKTVVIGVGTRSDYYGNNKQYYMRIMELCFIPTDQALPQPGLSDLAGTYSFHKLGSSVPVEGTTAIAAWGHGTMSIDTAGTATFPAYADSTGNTSLSDVLSFSYYSDVPRNPDAKVYTDFANFSTKVLQDGTTRYYDAGGHRLHTYYDYVSNTFGTQIAAPQYWRLEDVSPEYVNEHGSLSYNRDLFVMTRTDASGYSMYVGLK